MSGSTGTGRPLTMRCGWCRQHSGIDDARRGYTVIPTGRIAPLKKKGSGGGRVLQYRVEHRCQDCKRLGWSRHGAMLDKLVGAGFEVPEVLRGHFPNVERVQMLARLP